MVNVDRSTVNMGWVQTGLWWAGLGWADPDTWHAVMLPCHGRGLLLGFVHSAAHTVWLTVDQRSWFMDLR